MDCNKQRTNARMQQYINLGSLSRKPPNKKQKRAKRGSKKKKKACNVNRDCNVNDLNNNTNVTNENTSKSPPIRPQTNGMLNGNGLAPAADADGDGDGDRNDRFPMPLVVHRKSYNTILYLGIDR